MPTVREVVWLDDIASPEGILHYEDLTAYEPADDVGAAQRPTSPGLFYTGGTTGRSQRSDAQPHQPGGECAERRGRHRLSMATPPTSIPARCFHLADAPRPSASPWSAAATPSWRASRPVEVLQTIAREKVTHAQFVPTMIQHDRQPSALRGVRTSRLSA